MFYEHDITVLTTHTATNKLKESLKLTQGIIERLSVSFPPGCHNLVHVSVSVALQQIFPTNPEGNIKADAFIVEGQPFYPMFTEPFIIDIYGWGESCVEDHKITVRVWLRRLWEILPYSDEMYRLAMKEEEV